MVKAEVITTHGKQVSLTKEQLPSFREIERQKTKSTDLIFALYKCEGTLYSSLIKDTASYQKLKNLLHEHDKHYTLDGIFIIEKELTHKPIAVKTAKPKKKAAIRPKFYSLSRKNNFSRRK